MFEINNIYNMDCIEGMKHIDDNSIDSIVTDPPYDLTSQRVYSTKKEINNIKGTGQLRKNIENNTAYGSMVKGFMGKEWDGTKIAFNINTWKEAYRILKPGGYLLSFGGTRTYHRMASAIEDAGFEIRDMINWTYGCLSEDTEVLTNFGWMNYTQTHKTNTYLNGLLHILIYDNKRKIYKWEKPERWNVYSVHKDTCYRIKSDKTDQLLSRNHNCYIEREGSFILQKSEKLSSMEFMPTLPNDFFKLQERQSKILFKEMQRILQGAGLEEVGRDRKYKIKSTRIPNEEESQRRKESCLEGWCDLLQEKGQLRKIQDKICEMSRTIYEYGEKGWLCNGTQINNSTKYKQVLETSRGSASYRPQSRKQQNRELNAIQKQQGTQDLRGFDVTKAKVTEQEYTGIIYCPTTSTGLFVARRKGKIFVTGNSGFPKSLNIGKAIDKLQGNDREVIGSEKKAKPTFHSQNVGGKIIKIDNIELTKGTSEWEGWGTALKPACEKITMAQKPFNTIPLNNVTSTVKKPNSQINQESICMARKPLSEKTVAENVLKYGTGGINIDESRVGFASQEDEFESKNKNQHSKYPNSVMRNSALNGIYHQDKREPEDYTAQGRFPANFIHDGSPEVLQEFEKAGISKSNDSIRTRLTLGSFGMPNDSTPEYSDSGTPARFFKSCEFELEDAPSFIYQAKASKSERNEGCEELEEKSNELIGQLNNSIRTNGTIRTTPAPKKNSHPTVKPLKLMEYLVKLVTPKGGICLDPFMGSGTTAVACKKNGFKYLGFEKEAEYIKIINARLSSIKQKKLLEE